MSDAEKRDTPDTPALSLPVEELASRVRESTATGSGEDPELNEQADAFLRRVFASPDTGTPTHAQRETVDELGLEAQREAARRSALLQAPLRKLAHKGDDGGTIATALVNLRGRMQALDPNRHNLSTGGLDRILSVIPGVGNRLQRYFHKFETAQEALDAIIRDLEAGREMLRRDNITLADDQEDLRQVVTRLHREIALGRLIDTRLEDAAAAHPEDSRERSFIEEELLFPLRQRILDLQQQLTVSQQGILALEVVIRNNRELMRGVDRAVNVTVSALNVAVTVALGLANQRLVLDRIESLNTTTSELIAGTASALRGQGVEIQSRASSTVLDMEKLEQAFQDVIGAIDDLSRYRREALPKMDEQINRLDALATDGSDAIGRLERGNAASDRATPDD